MTEDRFWRIVLGAIIVGIISAFAPQIKDWLKRIGYTGWR